MANSMTGYGRAQQTLNDSTITVELRSVNHKFLEFTPKVPRTCIFLEDKLKTLLQQYISRGKVEMFLTLNSNALGDTSVEINHTYAEPYIAALKSLAEKYNLNDDISVSTVARNPEIFTVTKSEINEDELWNDVSTVATSAIESFVEMRKREGEKLKADILNRVAAINEKVKFIEVRSPETVRLYREKLEQRMHELLGDVKIDVQRLITETGIMADKLAVCEETVRLGSHMEQLCSLLDLDTPIGRKLDFIVQEMNRETNTIGSKAQDVEIARAVVEIKSEIEKIREQIQNIE